MELIYAKQINGNIVEQGILNNFTFDLAFGESENDFELICPLDDNTILDENMVIYVPNTEYGGVIDAKSVNTDTRMITYTGRTWHGILANKYIYPFQNSDYMIYSGEANEVIAEILERANLTAGSKNTVFVEPDTCVLSASTEDSGIEIVSYKVTSDSGNYCDAYDLIRDMLFAYEAKPVIINGVVSAQPLLDYSQEEDWVADTDQFTAKRTYNNVNHLHCLGQGDLSDRYTIDLYLSSDGVVLPYAHNTIESDADYYIDIPSLVNGTEEEQADYETLIKNAQTGMTELCQIYDYPNAQTTYHYVLQTEQPSDWDSIVDSTEGTYGFETYYQMTSEATDENDAEYETVDKPDMATAYTLQDSCPSDWENNFDEYYYQTSGGGYASVTKTSGSYSVLSAAPSDWSYDYTSYYYLNNGTYSHVTGVYTYVLLDSEPSSWSSDFTSYYTDSSGSSHVSSTTTYKHVLMTSKSSDWSTSWSNYYQTDGVDYSAVTGTSYYVFEKQTQMPSDWKKNYGNYWRKATKTEKKNNDEAKKVGYVAVTKTAAKKVPTWESGKYYTRVTKTKAPKWKKNSYYKKVAVVTNPTFVANTYYERVKVAPTFVSGTYYSYTTVPTWHQNTYYTSYEYQPIPTWTEGLYYTRNEDHYQALVEGGLKKLAEYQQQNELEIDLPEDSEYDINDIVGASDEVTGLAATARIVKKIVKIEKGIATITYEVGT